ncbi:hypothetical protein I3843_08G164000 [Carya illinoinensis]|nr:hypothetical protein I3843_08G164000 [Carya illinoinensis]
MTLIPLHVVFGRSQINMILDCYSEKGLRILKKMKIILNMHAAAGLT